MRLHGMRARLTRKSHFAENIDALFFPAKKEKLISPYAANSNCTPF